MYFAMQAFLLACGHVFSMWACIWHAGMHFSMLACGHVFGMLACILPCGHLFWHGGIYLACEHVFGMRALVNAISQHVCLHRFIAFVHVLCI